MSEPSLATQRAVAAALKGTGAVTALVPGANIFDRNSRPEVFPCVLLGEGQTVDEGVECFDMADVFLDIHVWTQESGFVDCKTIAGAVMRRLRGFDAEQDAYSISSTEQSAIYLRDPSGAHAHAVISVEFSVEGSGT